jgi:hypothetical protein
MAWPKGKPRRPSVQSEEIATDEWDAPAEPEPIAVDRLSDDLRRSIMRMEADGDHADAAALSMVLMRVAGVKNALPAAIEAAPIELGKRLRSINESL